MYLAIPNGLLNLISARRYLLPILKAYGFKAGQEQVIRLKKSLYGLKQSPRVWQKAVVKLLSKQGYKPLIADSAVYYNLSTGIFLVTYVDDCLLIGPDLQAINALKKAIGKVYPIDDLGPAAYYLGVRIIRDRPNRLIYLSQGHYILEVLKSFNMTDCKPIKIPIQPGIIAVKAPGGFTCNTADSKLYQRIVGCCMYLMTQTRVDISFTVQWLSRHLSQPSITHLNAAKNLLRYLAGSINLVVILGKDTDLEPKGFTDSDFAGSKDSKSTYGYLFKIAGGPIS